MEIIREDRQGRCKYYADDRDKDFELISTRKNIEIAVRGHAMHFNKKQLEKIIEILQDMKSRIK
jgi:DNA-binding FadR family transcriptional regulator